MAKCGRKCEVYSRVCGYHRPVKHWNKGKQEEFADRLTFDMAQSQTPKKHKNDETQHRTVDPARKAG